MVKCCYLFLLTIPLSVAGAAGQQPALSHGVESNHQKDLGPKLEHYVKEHPKERAYVQFDRSGYAVGDTVWYKVYLVDGYNNQLSALSKLVHVEVANGEGQGQRSLLPVNAGMANGHLVLSAQKFSEGAYSFNVHTRLTGNGDNQPNAFKLIVGLKGNAFAPIASSQVNSLRFYPEGGALVGGLRSRIVVKSVDAQGNPVPANGHVLDEGNNKVAEFSTGKSGMSLFAMSPKQKGKYRAILTSNMPHKSFDLPEVRDNGYVLAANSVAADTLLLRISKSISSANDVRVVFQANGSVFNVVPVSLVAGSSVLKVPKALLATGLNEVALFSMENTLLANRFLFVPEKKSSSPLNLGQAQYGTREQVKIRLNITDAAGAGVVGGYCISVARANEGSEENTGRRSIWPSLILNEASERQSLDFDPKTETGKAELDMQLITQGSGSFSWDEILTGNQAAPRFTPERSLSIGGQVLRTDGKPMSGAKLSLFAAKNMMLIDTVANENGIFRFENFSVLDSTEVVVRVTNLGSEKNVRIILDEEVENVTADAAGQPSAVGDKVSNGEILGQGQPDAIRSVARANELRTVEIVAKRRPVIPGSVYPFAAAPPDYTIEAEELHKIINLTDYLRSRFIGIVVANNKVMGRCKGLEGPMLILLNGQNIEDLSSVDPRSLTGVEIIKCGVLARNMANQFGESIYGQGANNGIIFLTSNHHNPNFSKVLEQTTGIIRKKIPGFPAPKAFYSPDYTIKKGNIAKDLRDPLFWRPDIITDKEGMAELDFYTSDEKGRFQVILEGIGINGKITREVAFFNVK